MVKAFWKQGGDASDEPIADNGYPDFNTPYLKVNPALKSYAQKFVDGLIKFSPARKVDMLYKSIVKKDPPEGLPLDKKLNRMLYEYEITDKSRETQEFLQTAKGKKKFKFKYKSKAEMKKSLKNMDLILVFFYTITGEIIGPSLYPIYSGNMVIVRNKPYELDPRAVWRFGKYRCISIKEIDRRPISNLDWDEIKRRGDATDSDEFLIKAAMRAYAGSATPKKPFNIWILVIIGVIVVGGLIFFFTQGGGAAATP